MHPQRCRRGGLRELQLAQPVVTTATAVIAGGQPDHGLAGSRHRRIRWQAAVLAGTAASTVDDIASPAVRTWPSRYGGQRHPTRLTPGEFSLIEMAVYAVRARLVEQRFSSTACGASSCLGSIRVHRDTAPAIFRDGRTSGRWRPDSCVAALVAEDAVPSVPAMSLRAGPRQLSVRWHMSPLCRDLEGSTRADWSCQRQRRLSSTALSRAHAR